MTSIVSGLLGITASLIVSAAVALQTLSRRQWNPKIILVLFTIGSVVMIGASHFDLATGVEAMMVLLLSMIIAGVIMFIVVANDVKQARPN